MKCKENNGKKDKTKRKIVLIIFGNEYIIIRGAFCAKERDYERI